MVGEFAACDDKKVYNFLNYVNKKNILHLYRQEIYLRCFLTECNYENSHLSF